MIKLALRITLLVALIIGAPTLYAQKQELTAEEKARIAEQRKVVEKLEEQLAKDELRLNEIKADKSNALKRMQTINSQIKSRTSLLTRTENEIISIEKNIALNDNMISQTQQEYDTEREKYAEMVREAYRNYRQNNYATYILASESFSDIARRIANIRAVASLRAARMERIDSLGKALNEQQASLSQRRHSLDSVQRKAAAQQVSIIGVGTDH